MKPPLKTKGGRDEAKININEPLHDTRPAPPHQAYRPCTVELLTRLEKVRPTGPDRWLARCPAHEDRNPSLSIRETEGGTVLLHCFAGCGASDVVAALGLSLSDLFPKTPDYNRCPPLRDYRHVHAARQALKVLDFDVLLVAVAAENLAQGIALTDDDRDALIEAAGRIRNARNYAS